MRGGGHVRNVEERNVDIVLVEKRRRYTLGRPRRRWEDNIKIRQWGIICKDVD
jgi:hypothetical protein